MSSVSGSDPNARAKESEITRRNREEKKTNETEQARRQKAEIQRITENHYRELESLRQSHAKQLEAMRKETNDAISERDYRYNRDMDEVRNLYRKELQDQASKSYQEKEVYRSATQADIKNQKAAAQSRVNQVMEQSNNNLQEKDRVYGKAIENLQHEQKETINHNKESLGKAHAASYNALADDRDRLKSTMQENYDRYRENAEGRIKNLQTKGVHDHQVMSENHMHSVQRERQIRDENDAQMREGFANGMDQQKERYQNALDKEKQNFDKAYDNLQADVGNRIEGKVRRLEHQNADLKNDNVRDLAKNAAQSRRTEENMRRAFQDNVNDLEDQRMGAVRDGAERVHKTAEQLRKEYSEQMVRLNRGYREQIDEQNRINKQAYRQAKGDFDGRIAQNNMQTTTRIKNMIENTETSKAEIVELAQENTLAQRRQSVDEIRSARNNFEDDRNKAVEGIRDQMRKLELNHEQKTEALVAKYEKQIRTLKDQQLQEKRLSEEQHKRTIEDLQRSHKMELEQVMGSTTERVRQMQEQHSQEIKAVNKRQDGRVEAVLAEVKRQQNGSQS